MGTNEKRRRRFFKQIFLLVLLVISFGLGLALYIRWYNASNKICGRFVPPMSAPKSLVATPQLCFEIAETESKRAKGLMFRKPEELGEREGMVFVYPEEGMRSFWMKNTFTALDIIFLDANKIVVGIVENATPLSNNPRKVGRPSQIIVELHAGSSKKWGISEGASLVLYGSLPQARE